MPKKKSRFLGSNKANYQTFSVVSRSRKDLHAGDPTESQNVLVSQNNLAAYGIDFDDDYDYGQHLKSIDEFYTSTKLEEAPVRRIRLPAAAFPNEPDVNVDKFASDISYYDDEVLDPDIEAALEGEADVDDELEDDFVALATGEDDVMEGVRCFEKSKSVVWAKFFDQDIDEDEEMSDADDSQVKSTLKPLPEGRKPLTYHQGVIEKQFEKLYEDFSRAGGNSCNESVYSGSSMVSKTLTYLASRDQIDFAKQNYTPESIIDDDDIKQKIIEASQDSDSDEEDPVEAWINADRREKIDCDVTSVRSSINPANIPRVIEIPKSDSSRSRRRKLISEVDSVDECEISEFKVPKLVPARLKNESLEEKRARKKAVKEIQNQRRLEKKANKLNFRTVKTDVISFGTQ